MTSPHEQAERIDPVELDAAYLFCTDGFRLGALMVARNDRQRAALEFLREKGVVYIDALRGHVGYRRHGGEAIDCGHYGRDIGGHEEALEEDWLVRGILERSAP